VGNKFISIINDEYITGGGTFRTGSNTMALYEIEDLGHSKKRQNTTKLFDMLSRSQQKELRKIAKDFNREEDSNNNEEEPILIKEKRVMDIDNLALKRKEGRWIIAIPVFSEYSHEGNGSYFYSLEEYVDYNGKVPKKLVPHNSLCVKWGEVLQVVPDALDTVSSPNKDLLVVLTDNKLLVFNNPTKGLEKATTTIDIEENQQIVLSQWAVGDDAGKWSETFRDYFEE
jgi:hypothetical protein